MSLTITALYAGLVGLLLLALSWQVVRNRLRSRVSLGSGKDPDLERAIRAQANLAEYAPVTLVLMVVLESSATAPWLLHVCGGVFLISRILHAIGITNPASPLNGRRLGIAGTWVVLLVLSLTALVVAIGRMESV